MKKLKENKPLQYLLGAILFILLSCYLPQQLLFWKLCTEQDQNIPPNTEVLVSACKKPVAIGVPGGEVLFVYEGRARNVYLLDLRTGEKRKVPNDPLLLEKGIFLSSELVWLKGSLVGPSESGYRPHYILDLTNGERYELVNLTWSALDDGKFDIKNYSYFQSAGQIFLHHSENRIIALDFNFRKKLDNNVVFSQSSLGTYSEGHISGELLEDLMKELRLEYEIVDFSLDYSEIPSPTGKYVVHNDGIYLSGTNTRFVDPTYTGRKNNLKDYFKSWYYDESAIVIQEVNTFLFTSPLAGSYYLIPTPILKLHLPEQ
jgi:hypothetical protein